MQSENLINSLNKSLTSETDNEIFEDFSARIQTYIDGQRWIKKHISVSPAVCSQYGWKCLKSDLLECITCGARLCVNDSKIGSFDSYKTCNEKNLKDLKEAHKKNCPWPLTPCPENFIKMTPMQKEESMSQFLKRVKSSLAFLSSLPKIKESAFTDLGFSEQQILSLCKMAGITTEDASQFGKSIVSLSATGWIITKVEESDMTIFKCDNCLRSVWSGFFCLLNSDDSQNGTELSATDSSGGAVSENSVSVSQNGTCKESQNNEEDSEEPTPKKKRYSLVIKKGEPFDPLYEHRPWCLWIHGGIDSYISSSSSDESYKDSIKTSCSPGWKIFIKSLLRNISDNQASEAAESPSKEQIRNAKSLLEMWTNTV